MLYRDSGIFLPSEHKDYEKIIKDLTVQQTDYFTDLVTTSLFYEKTNGGAIIPRCYPVDDEVEDIISDGEDINIECTIEPDSEVQKEIINWLTTTKYGILKAVPGIGKTVCTIAAICNRRKKTIIIIHKKDLIKQWIEEIIKFTNLYKEDIGILSSVSPKKYKETLSKPIVITTPHVIGLAVKNNKFDFIQEIKESNFGFMVIDEIHNIVGAANFSKSSIIIPVKSAIGLSATPNRNGITDKILKYHLGNVVEFKRNEEDEVIPKIIIIKKNFKIHSSNPRYINFGGKFMMSKYSFQSKKSQEYCGIVLYLIKKCYNQKRVTLVVGDFINPLLFFAEHCGIPKKDIGIFLPTANKKDILKFSDEPDGKTAFLTKRVIFSSYKAVRDGNNRKDISSAIMLTPCSNVIQLVGRTTRKLENKPDSIIFDLVDTDPTVQKVWNEDKTEKISKFEKSFLKRLETYKDLNWKYEIFEK